MAASEDHHKPDAGEGFQATRWSLVLAAHQSDSPKAQEALEQLCRSYWQPVYAFIRRRGHDTEPAKDLTQEFFARLLARQFLRVADRERGRFRTFLMACVEHFLSNERKKETAIKRGGGLTFLPLEEATADGQLQIEPLEELSPDKLLDRRWAMTVLDLTLKLLKQEYAESGKENLFDALQFHLSGAKDAPCSFAELGGQLGMTEAAVRQAASRMRGRFGELLRRTVAQTVASPQDLEAEMVHLKMVLSGQ
jgi:RNA polymerase sigma-70 factor (ECF subfamily)